MNEKPEVRIACPGVHTIIVHKDVLATGEECSERWAVPHGTAALDRRLGGLPGARGAVWRIAPAALRLNRADPPLAKSRILAQRKHFFT